MHHILNLHESIANARQMMERIRDDIKDALKQVPDNPNIARLSESPRCFAIEWSQLGNDWTPLHHDPLATVDMLISKIDSHKTVETSIMMLESIAKTGKLNMDGYTISVCPIVVEHIKTHMAFENAKKENQNE